MSVPQVTEIIWQNCVADTGYSSEGIMLLETEGLERFTRLC